MSISRFRFHIMIRMSVQRYNNSKGKMKPTGSGPNASGWPRAFTSARRPGGNHFAQMPVIQSGGSPVTMSPGGQEELRGTGFPLKWRAEWVVQERYQGERVQPRGG